MTDYEPRSAAVLAHLNASDAPLLGRGGEGQVYALDADEVVKVYAAGCDRAYLEALALLHARVAATALPFATPRILAIGEVAGTCYTRERRLHGQRWEDIRGHLDPPSMRRLLDNYLGALRSLHVVALDDLPYGQALQLSGRLTAGSWPAFLLASVDRALRCSAPDLAIDIADFRDKLGVFRELVGCLGSEPPRRLVHGDYHPGNLLFGEDLAVSAVLDFSPHTVSGDPALDLAGAVTFLDTMSHIRPEDTRYLRARVIASYGEAIAPLLDFYTLYNSLYFSDTKRTDPATYAWCVRHLGNADLWDRLQGWC